MNIITNKTMHHGGLLMNILIREWITRIRNSGYTYDSRNEIRGNTEGDIPKLNREGGVLLNIAWMFE